MPFTVKVTAEIKKDDQPFCDLALNYHNMDYQNVALVEGKFIGMLVALNEEAKAKGS
ncbi:unnamed protein product [marine sediment metagenome]|uniref:Uncharacterized protein n=1 Tax=marine sediment metagenome TaxID=412755 RepID=X0S6W5_9ZZZZ